MSIGSIVGWGGAALLMAGAFLLTLLVSPDHVQQMLVGAVEQSRILAVVMHVAVLAGILAGLVVKKARDHIYAFVVTLVALSATGSSIMYGLAPNVVAFGLILAGAVSAWWKGRFHWDFSEIGTWTWAFGGAGIVFGFYYLHWVEDPIWINALLYSPLGVVNCPSLLMISGFLILATPPRSAILESMTGIATLWFGFYGIFALNAYVDIVLVLVALFLIVRVGTYIPEGTNLSEFAESDSPTN